MCSGCVESCVVVYLVCRYLHVVTLVRVRRPSFSFSSSRGFGERSTRFGGGRLLLAIRM